LDEKGRILVAVTCRAHGLTKQASLCVEEQSFVSRDWDEAHLINTALDIHPGDPASWSSSCR